MSTDSNKTKSIWNSLLKNNISKGVYHLGTEVFIPNQLTDCTHFPGCAARKCRKNHICTPYVTNEYHSVMVLDVLDWVHYVYPTLACKHYPSIKYDLILDRQSIKFTKEGLPESNEYLSFQPQFFLLGNRRILNDIDKGCQYSELTNVLLTERLVNYVSTMFDDPSLTANKVRKHIFNLHFISSKTKLDNLNIEYTAKELKQQIDDALPSVYWFEKIFNIIFKEKAIPIFKEMQEEIIDCNGGKMALDGTFMIAANVHEDVNFYDKGFVPFSERYPRSNNGNSNISDSNKSKFKFKGKKTNTDDDDDEDADDNDTQIDKLTEKIKNDLHFKQQQKYDPQKVKVSCLTCVNKWEMLISFGLLMNCSESHDNYVPFIGNLLQKMWEKQKNYTEEKIEGARFITPNGICTDGVTSNINLPIKVANYLMKEFGMDKKAVDEMLIHVGSVVLFHAFMK